ncbi:hypothetical protein BWQ96_00273 [Gracilariopsis chorda]|uniref:Uncharacterized protein n=1 Tax=Gracilariopsis chorda TaxID=448386 RepID=A0A2V3J762_9FLOR|nr:hypothetical protein BWQ96_00273 [Gracilariopsis chorda]|eukprot:PXF50113.1 hypothetical protein BWQ96_00273 [Gracilariopsis chorda]
MSSQTDKKEEFRKYLDKGNVLSILTTVLTDLFELEPKPQDPALYLYQKFGEALSKDSKPPAQTAPAEAPQKDIEMNEAPQTISALPSKPAEPEPAPQPPPAQKTTESKPSAPEQSDPPSQPSSQPAPASAAASAANPPLSLPATSQ